MINDTPNTPGTIGYDNTKPATYSGSRPGVPINQAQRPDWASGRQEYDMVNDRSQYRLTVHAAGETFTALSEPTVTHTIDRVTAIKMLRELAAKVEMA